MLVLGVFTPERHRFACDQSAIDPGKGIPLCLFGVATPMWPTP